MKAFLLRACFVAVLPLALAACGSEKTDVGCSADNDCPAGFICLEGACRCRTDDSCKAGEYCNPYGTCQARPACLGNHDCDAGFICNSADPTGGTCIPADTCGSSVHCPFNTFCNPGTKRCTPGCRGTGDCQLGFVCAAGQCVPGGTAGDCTICPASPSPDPSYCDYGEVCTDAGTCVAHSNRASLCHTCGGFTVCPGNLECMVDDVTGGGYCAPTCQTDRDCPAGYTGCSSVVAVDGSPCDQFLHTGPCDCSATRTCPNGGRCLNSSEGVSAFCECVADLDCQMLSPDLHCVQFPVEDGGTIGQCEMSWRVCGKGEGITCQELTQGTAECREVGL